MKSDNSSRFIHSYLLDKKGGYRPLTETESDHWTLEAGILWMHFDYTNEHSRKWLRKHSDLDPLVIEALLTEDTRPRMTPVGDGLLIALRGVNLNPGAEPDDMISIRIWINETHIITTRMRDLLSLFDIIEQLKKGNGPSSSAGFLIRLVDRLVWRMNDTVDNFEDLEDEIEEQLISDSDSDARQELSTLRRQIITLRRYLAPQREVLFRLTTEKVSWISERGRLHLMESLDRLTRHIEDLDAVRDRATVAHEEMISRMSDALNKRMYVLSLIAAIFLPLGFLTGLLGINVGGIPGAENPMAFTIFLVFLIIIVLFQIVLFRWRKWF